jgi:hypothetical protein
MANNEPDNGVMTRMLDTMLAALRVDDEGRRRQLNSTWSWWPIDNNLTVKGMNNDNNCI